MEDKEYQELIEKEKAGTLTHGENRRLCRSQEIRYEQYINSLIDKVERTEEEESELARWNDDLMRAEFTIVGGM